MLDENLPIFYLSPSEDQSKPYNSLYYHGKGGDEPTPAYQVQRADPGQANSENQYLAALFDAYNPDILYAEINLEPQWSQPPSKEEWARKNGPNTMPPPPEPQMPQEFVIQLYNPDQHVTVKRESSTFGGTRYEFSMPQVTFRTQSTSELDKATNDPAYEATTPKIYFTWKRESKLNKDMSCWIRGNSSTVIKEKTKGRKEPDINVALCKGLKEVQIYESNLRRIEMEDVKGLEVVLLLSTVAIKDVYFSTDLYRTFHIPDIPGAAGRRRSSGAARPQSSGQGQGHTPPPGSTAVAGVPGAGPATNPRAQWAIDAETARLKAKSDAEAREVARKESQRRRENQRLAEEDEQRARKLAEDEERERRRRQRQVDEETERLKKQFPQSVAELESHPVPAQYAQPSSQPWVSSPYAQPPPQQHQQYPPTQQPPPQQSHYVAPPALPPRPGSWAPSAAPPPPIAPYDPNAYPQMPPRPQQQQPQYPQFPNQHQQNQFHPQPGPPYIQYPQSNPINTSSNYLSPNAPAQQQQQQHQSPPNKASKARRSFLGLKALAEAEGIIAGKHKNSSNSNNGRLRSQSSTNW